MNTLFLAVLTYLVYTAASTATACLELTLRAAGGV